MAYIRLALYLRYSIVLFGSLMKRFMKFSIFTMEERREGSFYQVMNNIVRFGTPLGPIGSPSPQFRLTNVKQLNAHLLVIYVKTPPKFLTC